MNIVKQYAVALILALASSIVAETLPPQFEGSNANAITFDADGKIHLESFSQEPSTIQSTLAHESDENDTLELVVRVPDRNITDSGWQPSLVLFFAPGATDIKDVTTPDNGFYNFEGMVTAFMNHRMYPTLGSYFNSNVKQEDGTFLSDSSYSETLPLPTTGTALKLSRRGGKISSYYSLDDGTTWSQIGSEHLLAPEYQSAPLKVGYRLHMEYQTSYRFETIPSIVSGGETEVTPQPAALSYFDGLNADLDSAECTDLDGCTLTGDSNVAKLLSRESFGGDVVFTSELTNRPIFGSGYQSGLWLFMVPANATLSSISDDDDVFRDKALATVGDKIYASTDYTYVYSGSNGVDQYLGQSWKNVDGFYKLQRINGKVGAFISPNGKIWTQIGNEIELPDELKDVPVKLGYRVQKNWAPGYEFRVRSDVSSDRVISTGNCPIETDPATNTSRYGEMKFCVRSSLGYSYGAANTFQEVNFIESLVKIRYNLESGFCVADFNVEPKERIETTQEEAYALQAWLCDTGSMTNYFNPDRQLPTRVTNYDTVDGTGYFNQGALITVCVSPDNVAYAEGIRMSSLTDFTWTRDTFLGLPSLEVQQTAIENSSPAGNYLTYYDSTACSGAEWCTFSSILVADFYINTGSVTGSGTAQLEFARRRLEEGDQRKLQGEDSSSTFDLNLGVIGAPSGVPSVEPSTTPSLAPSATPSALPSVEPSTMPSLMPSGAPSGVPSVEPSTTPSLAPSGAPSGVPSVEPSTTPSLEPSASPSSNPSTVPSATPSLAPSAAPSDDPSVEPSVSPSLEPSASPSSNPSTVPSGSPSGSPSSLPSALPSLVPSSQPSRVPSAISSEVPSESPSENPSFLPSLEPSGSPSTSPSRQPSLSPSNSPSVLPSRMPSDAPSDVPSSLPSNGPSQYRSAPPSSLPSTKPSIFPSTAPSGMPSTTPSQFPSRIPSNQPSTNPSASPSDEPSTAPSFAPSASPSVIPSHEPSTLPSSSPSASFSEEPSTSPSVQPSAVPSTEPSASPSVTPSTSPSVVPSFDSSAVPSFEPSTIPSLTPSASPSEIPSSEPSITPSSSPSASPSGLPSMEPSALPSGVPSAEPSTSPSLPPSTSRSGVPSIEPSAGPSLTPSAMPSVSPSTEPSSSPSYTPSTSPSFSPSAYPSALPSGPAALKTAGATSFGFYSLYCVTTLVGLALLA